MSLFNESKSIMFKHNNMRYQNTIEFINYTNEAKLSSLGLTKEIFTPPTLLDKAIEKSEPRYHHLSSANAQSVSIERVRQEYAAVKPLPEPIIKTKRESLEEYITPYIHNRKLLDKCISIGLKNTLCGSIWLDSYNQFHTCIYIGKTSSHALCLSYNNQQQHFRIEFLNGNLYTELVSIKFPIGNWDAMYTCDKQAHINLLKIEHIKAMEFYEMYRP